MDLTIRAEAFWNSLREAVDFTYLALDLAKVSCFVKRLLMHVLSVEVSFSVDSSGEVSAVAFDATSFLEICDSNELLVKLTGSVVQAVQRPNISLVDRVVLSDFRVT